MDTANLKAVILDWGGVCCSGAEIFSLKSLQEKLNCQPSEIENKLEAEYIKYYEGKITNEEFWNSLFNAFDIKPDETINTATLNRAYFNSYEIYADVLRLILKLRQKYKTALISNLTDVMRGHIQETYGLSEYFDSQTYSCDEEIQSLKPERKIFELALKKLNLSAEECLFIDDSEKNTEAARLLGFQVILFKDKEKVKSILNSILE